MAHVLVADDNRGFAELCRALLEDAGYTVTTAYSGLAAIAAVEQQPVAAAVLDVLIPQISGAAAAAAGGGVGRRVGSRQRLGTRCHEIRPAVDRVVPARGVVGVHHGGTAEQRGQAAGERALAGSAEAVDPDDASR